MKILLCTPAAAKSKKGNRVTADRWASILRKLGHRVKIGQNYLDESSDLLIALHAKRSHRAIKRFHRERPGVPLIVALTGTDLYHDLARSATARESLELATKLVLLQPHGAAWIPASAQSKVYVIIQSAPTPRQTIVKREDVFDVCVSGHLRPVKDPLRTAMAARLLGKSSKICVTHVGAALSDSMRQRALREMHNNDRYYWLGEQPAWKARLLVARSRLLVISSKLEGCPNVASEAIAAGVPIISTHISGMIGILGEDYPGYFPTGDTKKLANLLYAAESDKILYRQLALAIRRLAPLVHPTKEIDGWKKLLADLFA